MPCEDSLQLARNPCRAPVERGYPRFLYGNRIQQLRRISNNSRSSYRRTARPVQHPKRGDVSYEMPVRSTATGGSPLPSGFGELQQLHLRQAGHLQLQRQGLLSKLGLRDEPAPTRLDCHVRSLRVQVREHHDVVRRMRQRGSGTEEGQPVSCELDQLGLQQTRAVRLCNQSLT